MIGESDHDFHMRRARAELDLAYRSEGRRAMESHLRLSSLHMQRLRDLQLTVRPAPVVTFIPTAAGVFTRARPTGPITTRELEAVPG